jgi:hypothetical protein
LVARRGLSLGLPWLIVQPVLPSSASPQLTLRAWATSPGVGRPMVRLIEPLRIVRRASLYSAESEAA